MDWQELYFSARGRLDRQRYWLASLPLIGVQIVAGILLGSEGEAGLAAFGVLLYLASLVPSFVITVKRLHDRGRGGTFLLVTIIPLLGALWLLIEAGLLPGSRGPNRFGPDPLTTPRGDGSDSLMAPV